MRFTVLTQECKIVARLKKKAYGKFEVIWNVFELSRDAQIYSFFCPQNTILRNPTLFAKKVKLCPHNLDCKWMHAESTWNDGENEL